MLKRLSVIALGFVSLMVYPSTSLAETITERVARTGVLNVGVRTDLVPYTFVNDKQELTGYSVELIELIRQQLAIDLEREVKVNFVVSDDFSSRMNKVIAGELDLVCDTTFTWERDKYVDFSIGYSVSGIKLLVKKGSEIENLNSLTGKRIGFIGNVIQERTLKLLDNRITPVSIKTIEEGFQAVKEGKIDGFAFDSIILKGMRQTMEDPDLFAIVPQQSYFNHGVACMVPEGNSSFLDVVNYAIIKMMDGYLANDPRYTEMINRYFGEEGIVPIDPEKIRTFFEAIALTREQIPLD